MMNLPGKLLKIWPMIRVQAAKMGFVHCSGCGLLRVMLGKELAWSSGAGVGAFHGWLGAVALVDC
jgi:hypothetical protein